MTHDTNNKSENGAMKSYVTGFILSLIFTFIPYYLVDKQTVSGTALLVTILAFAVLQMIIQVTFFLHLGRGPKPNWNLFFFIATVGIIIMVVGGSILIINNLNYNMSVSDQTKKIINHEGIYQIAGALTGACQGRHKNHQIVIQGALATPAHVYADMCDTLTFVNEDPKQRIITFGRHPNHGLYAGETDLVVRSGKNKTITLSVTGKYQFHDHLQPETSGEFTISAE